MSLPLTKKPIVELEEKNNVNGPVEFQPFHHLHNFHFVAVWPTPRRSPAGFGCSRLRRIEWVSDQWCDRVVQSRRHRRSSYLGGSSLIKKQEESKDLLVWYFNCHFPQMRRYLHCCHPALQSGNAWVYSLVGRTRCGKIALAIKTRPRAFLTIWSCID